VGYAALKILSRVNSGAVFHGTVISRSSHAITSQSGIPVSALCQNIDKSTLARPHSGKRLRKMKENSSFFSRSQCHHRRTVRRAMFVALLA